MSFASPAWLLLLPAAVALLLAAARRRAKGRAALAAFDRSVTSSAARGRLEAGVELLGVAFLGFALAGPRLGGASGRDLPSCLFVLDGSRSMLAADVAPSRFEAACKALLSRARREPGRRFGLVVFSGAASEVCPPTSDVAALARLVAEVDPRQRLEAGSDVALGIERALARLAPEGGGEIVVLTDGEWDGRGDSPGELRSRAAAAGVSIHGEWFGGDVTSSAGAAAARVAALAGEGAKASSDEPIVPSSPAAFRLGSWLLAGFVLLAAAHAMAGRDA